MQSVSVNKQNYKFIEYEFPGVVGIEPFYIEDNRGYMMKDFSKEVFLNHGIRFEVEESLYITSKKNVLRGLHFQLLRGQPKVIQCIQGRIWAVVVDINPDRLTFGRWIEINPNQGKEVYVPGDYALGTLALEDSIIACKYGEKYYSQLDSGIKWDDADIGIKWPIGEIENLIISQKDQAMQSMKDYLKKLEEFNSVSL